MKLKLITLFLLGIVSESFAAKDSGRFYFERPGLMLNVFSWIGAGIDFPVDGYLSAEVFFRAYSISSSFTGSNSGSNFRINLKWHLNTRQTKNRSTNYLITGIDLKTKSESGYFQQNQYTLDYSQMLMGVAGIGRRTKRFEFWVAAEPALTVMDNSSWRGPSPNDLHNTGYSPYPTFNISAGLGVYLLQFGK